MRMIHLESGAHEEALLLHGYAELRRAGAVTGNKMTIPKKLEDVCERIRHPAVTATGITITDDGRWALLAQVRAGTLTPLKEVERIAGEFPVVYEEEPEMLQIARPAYPGRGE